MAYQLPQHPTFNERFHMWLAGKWNPERDDHLDNTRWNKYSMYHLLNVNPLFQNALIWNFAASIFSTNNQECNHSGLSGVKTHENGIHLYKSGDASSVVMRQFTDYMALGFLLGFASGSNFGMLLPTIYYGIQMPRKLNTMRYFCWHAELLPHTEQVVFHKTAFFGNTKRIIVDIRNLEKVESSEVDAALMWEINMFDPELCFKDTQSREIFVFDKGGYWNKEALEHPLLN